MRQGIAFFLICTLLISACATAPAQNRAGATAPAKPANLKDWLATQNSTRKKILVAATVLAVASAATGTNTRSMIERALAGFAVGIGAGLVVGRYHHKVWAARELAVHRTGYDASQGYVARVEEVGFNPPRPKPGTTATLYVRYIVIGPDPNEKIKVTMFRGLKYGDDYVFGCGPNEFVVPKGGGVVEATMDLTLPKGAPEGTYSVEALIEDAQGRFPQAVGKGELLIIAGLHRRGALRAA